MDCVAIDIAALVVGLLLVCPCFVGPALDFSAVVFAAFVVCSCAV